MSAWIAGFEFVGEARMRINWILSDQADSVHIVRSFLFNAMPVNARHSLGVQHVVHVDYDCVALANLNRWSGQHSIDDQHGSTSSISAYAALSIAVTLIVLFTIVAISA